ncbi:hypothetical protein JAAARDRAFT_114331, partial [Jaapia argillacea MUCL 33604]
PDTEAGLAAYELQRKEWARQYGLQTRVDHAKPYPLYPGTAGICTGECYRCATHGHPSNNCPA